MTCCWAARWAGAGNALFRHRVWYANDPGYQNLALEGGSLRLTVTAGMSGADPSGAGPDNQTTPALFTATRDFNRGTYAAALRYHADDAAFRDAKDRVVQAFWLQSPASEGPSPTYAECDMEYQPFEGALFTPTHDQVLPDDAGRCDAQPPKWKARLGGRPLILVVRVEPELSVVYEVYDEAGALLHQAEAAGCQPEAESAMDVFLNVWIEHQTRSLQGTYSMEADWLLHTPDRTDLTAAELTALVAAYRGRAIPRKDTIHTAACP